MSRPRTLKDAARELVNSKAMAWPLEVDGIRLMLMTEKEFYKLLEQAGLEGHVAS